MIRTILAALLVLGAAGGAYGDALDDARDAVARHPRRPGLKLILAQRLVEAGALDEAGRIARAILDRWPRSTRARLILAEIAKVRGDFPTVSALIAGIDAEHAALSRAALVQADVRTSWLMWGRVGVQYDSRATAVPAVFSAPARFGDGSAARGLFGAGASVQGRRWGMRGGLERTVHSELTATSADLLDRTALWVDGGRRTPMGGGRLETSLFARGALIGRVADARYLALGARLGWRRAIRPAPWFRLEGLGLTRSEGDMLAWARGSGGIDLDAGPVRLRPAIAGAWLGPDEDGFAEIEGRLRADLRCSALCPFLGGGVARRDDGLGARPRAFAGLRLALGRRWALVSDGAWQAIGSQQRWLVGLGLEGWR